MESDQVAELCRACECTQSNWKDMDIENHSPLEFAPEVLEKLSLQNHYPSLSSSKSCKHILPMLC